MSKTNIEIGKTLGNWKILERIKSEKKYSYTYKCECIACGNVRTYNKYYLKQENKLICTKCIALKRYKDFKKVFNMELNKCEIPSIKDIDINKSYKLSCEKGHIFIGSLASFEECIKCKYVHETDNEVDLLIKNKKLLEEYIYNKLKNVFDFDKNFQLEIDILDKKHIIKPKLVSTDKKIYIEILGKLDLSFVQEYHKDRNKFAHDLLSYKKTRTYMEENDYLVWKLVSTDNLNKDIEYFEQVCKRVFLALDIVI